MNTIAFIPTDLINLIFITTLSFLIGLELKTYYISKNTLDKHIGSAKTYTFIGVMGFVFYKIDISAFIVAFITLSILYAIHYFYKSKQNKTSIVSYLIMALVYCFGTLVIKSGIWFVTLLFILIVFILNYKSHTQKLLEVINPQEIETLGKFLLLSAVILPILPNTPIKYIGISPFKIWLVVVIISAISYGSYLARKFIFKNKGYLLTGILGGLYSSTATTVVLSKKALNINVSNEILKIINSSIIIATSMMYLRLLVIAFIFNVEVAKDIAIPLIIFTLLGVIISFFLYKRENTSINTAIDDRNPLELGTAFIFAFLFVAMMAITHYVTAHFGNIGLKILSFIVGFTDIDPFVLSLLTGKFQIELNSISAAIIIAAGSNNILKALYALVFSKNNAKTAAFRLFILGVLTIAYGLFFY